MERMKPDAAVEILQRHGLQVSREQAVLILEFVYTMAEIAVAQCLRDEDSRLIHSGEHRRTGREGV